MYSEAKRECAYCASKDRELRAKQSELNDVEIMYANRNRRVQGLKTELHQTQKSVLDKHSDILFFTKENNNLQIKLDSFISSHDLLVKDNVRLNKLLVKMQDVIDNK